MSPVHADVSGPSIGLVAAYRDRLAIDGIDSPITLGEGRTPLIPLPRLAAKYGLGTLYAKYEGLNPTGSFKDRGMTAAITHANANGAKAVVCASTGNTAASAAAYAARAGLACYVIVPEGKVALGKLAGAAAYGATVVTVHGTFDQALDLVKRAEQESSLVMVNSLNPARIEGQKTAAWETVEQLGDVPDVMALPVGNAGNITAWWAGYQSLVPAAASLPRMVGVQAAGAAPLVLGHPVDNPDTIATAIRIGRPARGEQALAAVKDSNGAILAATDENILEAYAELAWLEGVFCEPSSAAGLAGLKLLRAAGRIDLDGKNVVIVLTGHGLKDPDNAMKLPFEQRTIKNDLEAFLRACGQ